MATSTRPETPSRGRRRPLFPYTPLRPQVSGQEDKTQALWPWYLIPFREPAVSPECRAFVLGEYLPDDEEEVRILRSELADAATVRADANSAIVQAPGACSALRQDYLTKGFRLISPTTGEASGGPPLQIFEPQLKSAYQVGLTPTDPYIGIEDIVAELSTRQKWALAQIDAKIEVASEMAREANGQERRYNRAIVAALRRRRQAVENGIPTVKELQRFFKQFELQRLESRQDQRLKEQQALQGQINDQTAQIARLTSEISSEAGWPQEGAAAS